MMLAANPSKPKTPSGKGTKKMKSLSRFFKKEESKKSDPAATNSKSSNNASHDAGSVQLSVTSTSVLSTSSGKRGTKKRQQVINRFVSNEGSKSQKLLLWKDNNHQDGDITSEESTSSINFNRSQDIQVIYNHSPANSFHKSCPVLSPQYEEECESKSSQERAPPLPVPVQPPLQLPLIKEVRFAKPLIDFKVEIESSWDIYPGPQVDTKDKTKATLLDGYMSMHGVDFKLIGYDKEQVVQAQPKEKKYLAPDEVAKLRHQKERLAKYRRKLKKKQRKAREDRCHIKGKLAYEALEGYKARQERIIAKYKMAAPNAVEHRRRRAIKFALARAAKVVVQVQQRQNFLFAIRDAAEERQERVHQQNQILAQRYAIKHQMKRIMIHQASMTALMRLQRLQLHLYEVSCEPIVYEMAKQDDDNNSESETSHDDESTCSSLDVEDWTFKRLEWAQVSFQAAAKSQEFTHRRPVEV